MQHCVTGSKHILRRSPSSLHPPGSNLAIDGIAERTFDNLLRPARRPEISHAARQRGLRANSSWASPRDGLQQFAGRFHQRRNNGSSAPTSQTIVGTHHDTVTHRVHDRPGNVVVLSSEIRSHALLLPLFRVRGKAGGIKRYRFQFSSTLSRRP